MGSRLLLAGFLGTYFIGSPTLPCKAQVVPKTLSAIECRNTVQLLATQAPTSDEIQIMSLERSGVAQIRTSKLGVEIDSQRLPKDLKPGSRGGATNVYRGVVDWKGKKEFRVNYKERQWRYPFWSEHPEGYVDMAFLDPDHFDTDHYALFPLPGSCSAEFPCQNYQICPKARTGSWNFVGVIGVSVHDSRILRICGAYHPLHRERLFHLREDFNFPFDSRRKEIRPGVLVPDVIFTGVDSRDSDFIKPTIKVEVHFSWQGITFPSAFVPLEANSSK